MKYENITKGIFYTKINRFTAETDLGVCHIKNTGRLKEILLPGTEIYLQESTNPFRKTKYDLIAAYKNDRLINIDSFAPNIIVKESIHTLFPDVQYVKQEATYKNSRFDFFIKTDKENIFIEVKGVTQEKDNIAMFPDAPTLRGLKHVNELIECAEEGFSSYIIFVIQMNGIKSFTPNHVIHNDFASALKRAKDNNVNIKAFYCNVLPDEITLGKSVSIVL